MSFDLCSSLCRAALAIGCVPASMAQDATPLSVPKLAGPSTPSVVRTWTTDEGLPSSQVRCVLEGSAGALWVGTSGGLARIEGEHIETWDRSSHPGLPHDDIYAIHEAHDGALWLGTRDGLGILDGGEIRSVSVSDADGRLWVTQFTPGAAGELWFATSGQGVGHVSGDRVALLPVGESATSATSWSVSVDDELGVLVASADGLFQLRAEQFVRMPVSDQLPSTFITGVVRDENRALYLSTMEGLVELDPNGERVLSILLHEEGPSKVMRVLLDEERRVLWSGLLSGGAAYADGARLSPASIDPRASVLGLELDRHGDMWFATSSGLVQYQWGTVVPIEHESVPRGVKFDAGGALLSLGEQQVERMEAGQRSILYRNDLVPRIQSFGLHSDGSLWAGLGAQIARVDVDGEVSILEHPRKLLDRPDVVTCFEEAADGAMWIGASSGLYVARLEQGWAPVRHEPLTGLHPPTVHCLRAMKDGVVWVGGSSTVIEIRPEGSTAHSLVQKDRSHPTALSFAKGSDGETLWIGTDLGLGRLTDGDLTFFTRREGLPEDSISGVTVDPSGFVWIATQRGVHCASETRVAEGASAWMSFMRSDGLPSSNAADHLGPTTLAAAPDGSMFVCTAKGLARIRPDDARPRAAPSIRITGLQVDGAPRSGETPVELAPGTRRVRVEVAAAELRSPEKVRYRFRRTPGDVDWIEGGSVPTVDMGELRPGRYQLHVQASVDGENWSAEAAELDLVQLAAFHETLSFRGFLVLLAGGVIALVYRSRVTSIARREAAVREAIVEERTRVAGEVHDSLAQSFAAIALQLEAAEDAASSGGNAVVRNGVSKAKWIARYGLSEARRSALSLRPSTALEGGLCRGLEMLTERTSVAGKLDCTFTADQAYRELAPDVSLGLFRVAQEAVGNAVRHANAKHIALNLERRGEQIHLSIEDDGVGLPNGSFLERGTGLRAMRERLAALGGELRLAPLESYGFRVDAQAPWRESPHE